MITLRRLAVTAGTLAVVLATSGCICVGRYCCDEPCDGSSPHVPPGPTLRVGVVQVQRTNAGITQTIGWVTSDPADPSIAWWLMRHNEAVPIELGTSNTVKFTLANPMPVTSDVLCTTKRATLMGSGDPPPQLYQVNSAVGMPVPCH